MSQLQSDSSVPSTIDMRMESPWPEEMPPVPALPIETQLLLESETTTDSDARDWTELLEQEEQRYQVVRVDMLKLRVRDGYAHLVNSKIDWELEAPIRTCRVEGLSCYGKVFGLEKLKRHLKSQTHIKHDASLPPRVTTPAPATATAQTTDHQASPISGLFQVVNLFLKHTTDKTIGDDITLDITYNEEALESAYNIAPLELEGFPTWVEIPDSEEDSDDLLE
ncbi:hypothetical protein ACHAPJ_010875 [Fusarium lateritium]